MIKTQKISVSLVSKVYRILCTSLFVILFIITTNYYAHSRELPAEQANILEASSEWINLLKGKQKAVDDIFDKVNVDVSSITKIPHIKERRLILKEFIKANAVLMETRKNSETFLTKGLEKRGVTRKSINAYLKGYRERSKKRQSLILKIDDTNTRSMETWLKILDLLEAKWGKWQPDTANASIQSEDENLIVKFNKLLEKTWAIADEQAEFIKKLQSR